MIDRFRIVFLLASLFALSHGLAQIPSSTDFDLIKKHFCDPPPDCWPHTRWWWPGNTVTKEGISWQLEQMKRHGITGVEQITMAPFYEKGNIPYLSEEFLDMLKYMVAEAKRLGMEVSLNFGGPGWIIGGSWVPEEDRSKDMVPTFIDLEGPATYKGPLADSLIKTARSWEHFTPVLDGDEVLLAVMAGKLDRSGQIDPNSIVLLSDQLQPDQLVWQVPEGSWRLMAFWLKKNGISNAVDHFSKEAIERYCNHLGGLFYRALGEEFGKTVESLFVDSFELANLASGIYWSEGLLEAFEDYKGYDLKPYLPAIWWNMGEVTPKIRYDVNEFLHHTGLEAFFKTFTSWCEDHGVRSRIQGYGFPTDNLKAAGMTHIPEMEITPGEKDAAEWFDTRIGPKKYVASGAHIYGRDVMSAEVYTFIHWERYRATLEELKIASDGYLRAGATKFYNHGFSYTPEKELAPSRMIPFAAHIHPQNVWWEHYPLLAEYIARCSYLLRQGDFVADIALYSPLANQWTRDVLNPRRWTRDFDWGDLGDLIMANGYDFDLLNDDALQNLANIENGTIAVNQTEYQVLLLPNIEAIPLETLRIIEKYVRSGGTVIALDRLPRYSTGLADYLNKDAEVQVLVENLFSQVGDGYKNVGAGQTYFFKLVIGRDIWWDKFSSALDPFLNTIRAHVAPDVGIDFAAEGLRRNDGLSFQHRRVGGSDIYFVTNMQEKACHIPVTFRVKNKLISKWDPYSGSVEPVLLFKDDKDGVNIPLKLGPYESIFYVFRQGRPDFYASQTGLSSVEANEENGLVGYTDRNGVFSSTVIHNGAVIQHDHVVSELPSALTVGGKWQLEFKGRVVPEHLARTSHLYSWADQPETRHFSGTCRYLLTFNVPSSYIHEDHRLKLDLGKLGTIAEVWLNGDRVGVIWMRGQKLDVTQFLSDGINTLQIDVTNTLINEVSALHTHKPLEEGLVERFGGSAVDPNRIPREFGFKPLPASGLLGPVSLQVEKKISIPVEP